MHNIDEFQFKDPGVAALVKAALEVERKKAAEWKEVAEVAKGELQKTRDALKSVTADLDIRKGVYEEAQKHQDAADALREELRLEQSRIGELLSQFGKAKDEKLAAEANLREANEEVKRVYVRTLLEVADRATKLGSQQAGAHFISGWCEGKAEGLQEMSDHIEGAFA